MKRIHILYAIFVAFCWGINAPLVKMSVHSLPPFLFSALRSALLGLLVIFFPKSHIPLKTTLWFTLLHGIKISLLYFALKLDIESGISSVLLQTQSLFAVLLAVIFFKERITFRGVMGLLVAFGGVCMIGLNLHGQGNTLGMLMILASAFVAAISFLVTKEAKKGNYLSFVGYFNLYSVIPFLILSYISDGPQMIATSLYGFDLYSLGLLFLSALTVVGAYVCLVYLMGRYPSSQVAPYFLLMPIFGLSGGYMCLGEWCSLQGWVGSLIVILGLALNQWGQARSKI